MGAKIARITVAFPENKVSNDDLACDLLDWDPARFARKTGITSRYISAEDETALDLAEKACRKLSPVELEGLDFIVFCTETPDYLLPHNSALLQARLGLSKEIGTFDINLGCSGYVYALVVCKGLIACRAARSIALVTGDTLSKCVDPHDRGTRPIFGDAATVTLITESSVECFGEAVLGTDGAQADALIAKGTGIRGLMDKGDRASSLYMDGGAIFSFMLSTVPLLIEKTLKKNGIEKDSVDMFVFHQANAYMLEYLRECIGIHKDKFFNDCSEVGNTVSSTIPIALSSLLEQEKISAGDTLLLSGFGVGLSWSAMTITL